MKTFKVGCYQTEHFSIYVTAEDEDAAQAKAFRAIEESGVPADAEVFDREFDSVQANECTTMTMPYDTEPKMKLYRIVDEDNNLVDGEENLTESAAEHILTDMCNEGANVFIQDM